MLLVVAFLLLIVAYAGNPQALFGNFVNWIKGNSIAKAPMVQGNVKKQSQSLGKGRTHPTARKSKTAKSRAVNPAKETVNQKIRAQSAKDYQGVMNQLGLGKGGGGAGAGELGLPGLPGLPLPAGAGG